MNASLRKILELPYSEEGEASFQAGSAVRKAPDACVHVDLEELEEMETAFQALPRTEGAPDVPLYVDLDGTLTYTDLLFESVLLLLKRNLLYVFLLPLWLLRGPSCLKAEVARRVQLDVSSLPYNQELLAHLRVQHGAGRRLVLASAGNGELVRRVAEHLGIFAGWLASDDTTNLKGRNKLLAIERDAASRAYAYAGNAAVDLPIWGRADEIIVVNAPASVLRKASSERSPSLVIAPRPFGFLLLGRALRLHQWAKNALLFAPLLAAHDLSPAKWGVTLLAFLAFGLSASATYIINDLLDLASDRAHPRKRMRPFAAAHLSIPTGVALVGLLMPLSLWLAAQVSLLFMQCVLLYMAVTLAYSMRLKQMTFIDVLTLAFLYTYRVLAGGVASGLAVSSWLLTLSLFIFLSLALVKRCSELEVMNKSGVAALKGRGYRDSDLPYLISMGIASGFVAVMVLALYINEQAGAALYPNASVLWLILPIMLFWIMRLWIKVSRMEIHDDPMLFAITDPASWSVAALIAALGLAASWPGLLA